MATISKKEVKTFVSYIHCDVCGKEMEFTGETLLTYPPIYVYKCPICGAVSHMKSHYPLVEYEIISDEIKK